MEEESEKEFIFLLRDFGEETLKEFYLFSLNPGPKVIFLCSSGGSYSACVGFLDVINRYPEEYTIRVSEYVMSAAMQLIRLAKCPVEDISSQHYLSVTYIWHSVQKLWMYKGMELKNVKKDGMADFKGIEHILTRKQIRKRKVYVFLTGICKQFARVVNDDMDLTTAQIQKLLGSRFSVQQGLA